MPKYNSFLECDRIIAQRCCNAALDSYVVIKYLKIDAAYKGIAIRRIQYIWTTLENCVSEKAGDLLQVLEFVGDVSLLPHYYI